MPQESTSKPLPRWVDITFKATAFIVVMSVALLVVALCLKGVFTILGSL